MAFIQPEGLFKGQRLRACSDQARLLWPYLFLASNGFGRLEIDYDAIRRNVFVDFRKFPKLSEFLAIIREYHENGLLFLYEFDGRVWGQWDSKPGTLPRYKSANDKNSPEPPVNDYENWLNEYSVKTKGLTKVSEILGNFPKVSVGEERRGEEKRGVGVGVGEERGGEVKEGACAPAPPSRQKTFTAPTPAEVRAYASEIGYRIDAEHFCDYYATRGWKVGNRRMPDWQETVRSWERKEYPAPVNGKHSKPADPFGPIVEQPVLPRKKVQPQEPKVAVAKFEPDEMEQLKNAMRKTAK